ncbi:MAG: hypothetical protein R3C68_14830 [Myxococcota bacterium]
MGEEDETEARESLLVRARSRLDTKGKASSDGITFDLGGDGIQLDFAEEGFGLEDFNVSGFKLESEETRRFDAAMSMMTDEKYARAAQEFRFLSTARTLRNFTRNRNTNLRKRSTNLIFLIHP